MPVPGPRGVPTLIRVRAAATTVGGMARYATNVRTDLPPGDAFDLVADLRRLADWDPGIRRVVQVEGDGPGLDASYDVTAAAIGRDLTFRYRTVEHQPPWLSIVVATGGPFVSEDRIVVRPDGAGSVVTYDATLRLRGPLALGDWALRPVFARIGDRAAAGLLGALDGVAVPR